MLNRNIRVMTLSADPDGNFKIKKELIKLSPLF